MPKSNSGRGKSHVQSTQQLAQSLDALGQSKRDARRAKRQRKRARATATRQSSDSIGSKMASLSNSLHHSKPIQLAPVTRLDSSNTQSALKKLMRAKENPFTVQAPQLGGTDSKTVVKFGCYNVTNVVSGGWGTKAFYFYAESNFVGFLSDGQSNTASLSQNPQTFYFNDSWNEYIQTGVTATNGRYWEAYRILLSEVELIVRTNTTVAPGNIYVGTQYCDLNTIRNKTFSDLVNSEKMVEVDPTVKCVRARGGPAMANGGYDFTVGGYGAVDTTLVIQNIPTIVVNGWADGTVFDIKYVIQVELIPRPKYVELLGATPSPILNANEVYEAVKQMPNIVEADPVKTLRRIGKSALHFAGGRIDNYLGGTGLISSAVGALSDLILIELPHPNARDWPDYNEFSDGTLPSVGDTYMTHFLIQKVTSDQDHKWYYLALDLLDQRNNEKVFYYWYFPKPIPRCIVSVTRGKNLDAKHCPYSTCRSSNV